MTTEPMYNISEIHPKKPARRSGDHQPPASCMVALPQVAYLMLAYGAKALLRRLHG